MPLALIIAEALIKYGPNLARELMILLKKDDPTQADWDKVFSMAQEPWKQHVDNQ